MLNYTGRSPGVNKSPLTHDLGTVRRFSDKTLLLGHGEQMAFGDTGEIIDRYVYRRGDGAEEKSEVDEEGTEMTGEKEQDEKTESEHILGRDGKVVITGVGFLDKLGSENTRFNSFDPMTVRIHYHASERIFDPVFGIALYTEQGHYLYGTNTWLKEVPIGHVEGGGIRGPGDKEDTHAGGTVSADNGGTYLRQKALSYDWDRQTVLLGARGGGKCWDRGGAL